MPVDAAEDMLVTSKLPVKEIVFNAHAHYSIPDKDIGFLAKTAELLRISPKESMSFDGPALPVSLVAFRWPGTYNRQLPSADSPGPFLNGRGVAPSATRNLAR